MVESSCSVRQRRVEEEMVVRKIAWIVLGSLVACSSKTEEARPDTGAAVDTGADTTAIVTELTVEYWTVDFWGRADDAENARRRKVMGTTLAAGGSDVLCLNNVWRAAHRDELATLAKAHYGYAVHFPGTLETKATDPTDQTGKTPPEPTQPPCTNPETTPKTDAVYACLTKNCSTKPDSMDGYFTNFKCYESNCIPEGLNLITSDPLCAGCGQVYLEDSPFATGQKECTTNPKAGFLFSGEVGNLLLSKYPIKKSETFYLPSTKLREEVIRAEIDVGGGKTVDVYCGATQIMPDNLVNPYIGAYGEGKEGVDGWIAENKLETQRLVSFVKKASTGPAIVLVSARTSREYKDGGTVVTLSAKGFENIDLLETAFTPGVMQGYKPLCTDCGDHPAHIGSDPFWRERILLKDIPQSAVKSTVIGRKELIIPWPADGTTKYPLSGIYSIKSTIAL
jgi:hypothetical protein